jgi:cytoskeletal protein CcmA (bactofilin family)
MKKLLAPTGLVLMWLLATAMPAAAQTTQCNSQSSQTGAFGRIEVPSGGTCILSNARVGGGVRVGEGGYFEASGSTISGSVEGTSAQTIYIHDHSTVGGDVEGNRTAQVFLFNSTVLSDVEIRRATDTVDVCGMTVRNDLEVKDSGPDVLVGNSDTSVECPGNLVLRGDLEVKRNATDDELVVESNRLLDGDLEVNGNRGSSNKSVRNNSGMSNEDLVCKDNEAPFTGSPNTGFDAHGQCDAAPASPAVDDLTCNDTYSGITVDDVVVPANGTCKLTDSTVAGRVTVRDGGYFEARGTTIANQVHATRAETLFIDAGSVVGSDIEANRTAQVFLYNSLAAREIDARRANDVVNVCGMTVRDDLEVKDSSDDILVGSSDQTTECAGNVVLRGDIEVERNVAETELVVQSNDLLDGDLEVNDNSGSSEFKLVQNNTGRNDERIVCEGNESPFTGSPNAGFGTAVGQCSTTPAV